MPKLEGPSAVMVILHTNQGGEMGKANVIDYVTGTFSGTRWHHMEYNWHCNSIAARLADPQL